ncbi:MAG TPA: prepilin-type N-terminal cleavage/methylation domain-containing protein [Thermoanaerobaculia bacterium]|nr:prepilin-type N-terminal cleavage/methylation domain-containing protein [Thermoanaerobaculia bacterium]
MKRKQRQSGYSLPELLVVIAIIGLITMVSVPAFMSIQRSSRLKASLRSFSADMRAARGRAVSKHVNTKIGFVIGTTSRTYTIYEFSGGAYTAVKQKALESGCYFAGQSQFVTTADGLPDYDVVFRPDGTIVFDDATVTEGTITIATQFNIAKRQYVMHVGNTGWVRVKDV